MTISLSFCNNDLKTKEIAERVQNIRSELLNNKMLPSAIRKIPISFPGQHEYLYSTFRKENTTVDSVDMTISILDKEDSFWHLLFHEILLKNGRENKSYTYSINKDGIIDWAYNTEGVPKIIYDDNGQTTGVKSPEIIEINTDSSSPSPLKKPDEKTLAKYTARLKTTLDELDKMLSAK